MASAPSPPQPSQYQSACIRDIPVLIDFLRPHLPRSSKVLHTLRTCQTSFYRHMDVSIFVDSLHSKALTTIVLTYATRNESPPSDSCVATDATPSPLPPSSTAGRNVCFFTLVEAVALAMLKEVVHYTAQFDFAGIDRSYRPLVTQLARWWEQQPHPLPVTVAVEYDPCQHFAYTAMRPPTPSPSPTASPSLTLTALPDDAATASLIASHWPYASASTPLLVQNLLTHFGGVGAYRDGRLVAWVVKQLYGAHGMVHVVKEERGKGVGRALIADMVRRELLRRQMEGGGSADQDSAEVVDEWTPFCYINDGNEASTRLFTAVGYKPHFDIDWMIWMPTTASTS
jgi:GNAT superfamily N-acetyltransferase